MVESTIAFALQHATTIRGISVTAIKAIGTSHGEEKAAWDLIAKFLPRWILHAVTLPIEGDSRLEAVRVIGAHHELGCVRRSNGWETGIPDTGLFGAVDW